MLGMTIHRYIATSLHRWIADVDAGLMTPTRCLSPAPSMTGGRRWGWNRLTTASRKKYRFPSLRKRFYTRYVGVQHAGRRADLVFSERVIRPIFTHDGVLVGGRRERNRVEVREQRMKEGRRLGCVCMWYTGSVCRPHRELKQTDPVVDLGGAGTTGPDKRCTVVAYPNEPCFKASTFAIWSRFGPKDRSIPMIPMIPT